MLIGAVNSASHSRLFGQLVAHEISDTERIAKRFSLYSEIHTAVFSDTFLKAGCIDRYTNSLTRRDYLRRRGAGLRTSALLGGVTVEAFLERFLPGASGAMRALRQQISRLNTSRNLDIVRTVLIVGESGSGKTYVAKVLAAHREAMSLEEGVLDDNTNLDSFLGRFDEINLPNLPDTLVESELFGHVKGAFTGAEKEKLGLLSTEPDQAKSDILLDEIGDASSALQAKLLQVVESGRFRKLGASPGDDEKTEARLIFATNRNLSDDVSSGRFRPDLLWRLGTVTLLVPPLRERADQIEEIVQSTLQELLGVTSHASFEEPDLMFSESDLLWARTYDWPGNVRQLRSAVTRWVIENGERSFREIVIAGHHNSISTVPRKTSSVSSRLESLEPVGTLKDLLDLQEKSAKREIVDWFDRTRPTNTELASKFPGMKPRSVRNKLSDWRRELE